MEYLLMFYSTTPASQCVLSHVKSLKKWLGCSGRPVMVRGGNTSSTLQEIKPKEEVKGGSAVSLLCFHQHLMHLLFSYPLTNIPLLWLKNLFALLWLIFQIFGIAVCFFFYPLKFKMSKTAPKKHQNWS